MNTNAHNPATNGQAQEHRALDKPAGEAVPEAEASPDDEAMGIMAAQLAMLERMRTIGLAVMERIERHTAGLLLEREKPAFKNCDPILAINRITRSMLQVMAMEQEILGLREKRRQEARAKRVDENRKQVRRAVRDAAIVQWPDVKPDRLRSILYEAIYDHNHYDDFAQGSPREIIARICGELGIENPDLSIWPDGQAELPPTADAIPENETPEATLARLEIEFARARAADMRPNGHDPP